MQVTCFSSFTFSYLDRARVLYASLRKWHPDWRLVALITDRPPESIKFDVEKECFDEVIYSETLPIDNIHGWLFKHDIVEVSTAVKGPFLEILLARNNCDLVVYLDPDICLFNRLAIVDEWRGNWSIALTPHQLVPDDDDRTVIDNEITSLATGVYNLGFIAVANDPEGCRFAQWWAKRLLSFCVDDIGRGLFVDQRWCDHVPSFFNNVFIIKDAGYNVASWNLSQRTVNINHCGAILVNGLPLRFWHFTKLGPVGETMTMRYARNNYPVYEVWNWYAAEVDANKVPNLPERYWHFKNYSNGEEIRREHRQKYRNSPELMRIFPNPFDVTKGWIVDWLGKGA